MNVPFAALLLLRFRTEICSCRRSGSSPKHAQRISFFLAIAQYALAPHFAPHRPRCGRHRPPPKPKERHHFTGSHRFDRRITMKLYTTRLLLGELGLLGGAPRARAVQCVFPPGSRRRVVRMPIIVSIVLGLYWNTWCSRGAGLGHIRTVDLGVREVYSQRAGGIQPHHGYKAYWCM